MGRISRVYNCQKQRLLMRVYGFLLGTEKKKEFTSKYFPRLFTLFFYFARVGRFPNLRNPQDLNEKLLSLKLREYRKDQYIADCADKYKVRQILIDKGYGHLLPNLYGVFDYPEDIDFDKLPSQFVIKMNHGSGYNIICKDKDDLNIPNVIDKLNQWKEKVYGLEYGEWQYSNIIPKTIVEEFLPGLNNDNLIDYKFQCLNGKVHSIFICYDRTEKFVKFDSYLTDWTRTDYIRPDFRGNRRLLDKPRSLNEMVKIAEELSADFEFVRVDLYDIDGQVRFSEFTFTPHSSVLEYYKQEVLDEMGSCLVI